MAAFRAAPPSKKKSSVFESAYTPSFCFRSDFLVTAVRNGSWSLTLWLVHPIHLFSFSGCCSCPPRTSSACEEVPSRGGGVVGIENRTRKDGMQRGPELSGRGMALTQLLMWGTRGPR